MSMSADRSRSQVVALFRFGKCQKTSGIFLDSHCSVAGSILFLSHSYNMPVCVRNIVNTIRWISTKLTITMCYGTKVNTLDLGSKGQRSRSQWDKIYAGNNIRI